jgi:hypothetical protein
MIRTAVALWTIQPKMESSATCALPFPHRCSDVS